MDQDDIDERPHHPQNGPKTPVKATVKEKREDGKNGANDFNHRSALNCQGDVSSSASSLSSPSRLIKRVSAHATPPYAFSEFCFSPKSFAINLGLEVNKN